MSPQKRYPFEFHQDDPAEYVLSRGHEFDAIHFSVQTKEQAHWARNSLLAIGKPYIMEGEGLLNPTMLCGDMFALGCWLDEDFYRLRRHRFFETTFDCEQMKHYKHVGKTVSVYGKPGGSSKRDNIRFPGTAGWREAMGIDWMIGDELAQAIPPAYTQFIGEELLKSLRV